MSFQEIEKLNKAELKSKLAQMGMSLDRNDHPRDYYVQLYLEKTNSKNKVTRDNTPFYKNKVLKNKREREKTKEKDKELLEDPNYEEEEYEEEEEIKDDEDEDYIYEEEEEQRDDNNEREKTKTKRKRKMKNKIEDKYIDYRESGIKITRLIRKKKEKMLKGKKVILENPNQNNNVKRRILNNYEEMAGRNGEYNYNNVENNFSSENAVKPNINLNENNNYKNNGYYQYQNNQKFPEDKSGVINIKVENISDYNNNKDYNQEGRNLSNERSQFSNTVEAITPNKISGENKEKMNVSFGAPKNDQETHFHLLSNGPVSFGCNQNSTMSKLKDNFNDNSDRNNRNSQKYDFFLKNLTKSIKNDVKESQKPKRVLLKWDSPQQKEFLCSSLKKGDFGPSNENIDSNNSEQVTLEYPCYGNPNLEPNDRLFSKPPNKQIVSESIKNTIISPNDNNNIGNSNQNDYKSKLRSYYRNKGEQTNINDYNKNISNMNNLGKGTNDMNYKKNTDNYQNLNNININNNPNDNNQMARYENNKIFTNDINNNNLPASKNDNNKVYTNDLNNDNNQMANYENNKVYTDGINNNNLQMAGNTNKIYTNDINNDNNQMDGYENNKIYTNEVNNDYNNYTNPISQNNNQNENNNVMLEDMIEYNEDNNDNTNNINNNNNMFNENSMNYNNNNNMMANNNNMTAINNNYNQNYNMPDNNLKNRENQSEISTSTKNSFGIRKFGENLKNNIMSKFRKYAYLFPIIILIAFGIVYLVNERSEHFERRNIIISFTVLMALLIIYLLVKYLKDLRKYKKMAREDRLKLLKILGNLKINKEELANHNVLLNNFIESRIAYYHITEDEYINYVFPYLTRFLKKDGFYLEKVSQDKCENNISYWKEI